MKRIIQIIFISICCVCFQNLNAQNYRFEKISIEDGLSQSVVNCILQDKQGFIWFGTGDGLNRYDGYEFKVYKSSIADSSGILGNYISDIKEDQQGIIWIATTNTGLSNFNPITETFTNYSIANLLSKGLVGTEIISLYVDVNNNIWIGTNLGLNRFVEKQKKFIHYPLSANKKEGIQGDYIKVINGDEDGNLWIGTNRGISKLSKSRESLLYDKIVSFEVEAPEPFVSIRGAVEAILFDEKGSLWVGSGGGIHLLDSIQLQKIKDGKHKDVKFASYSFDEKDVIIMDLLKQEDGKLWVATFGNGIKVYDTNTKEFFHITDEKNPPHGLSVNDVYCLFKDNSGTMWIGTGGGGINKLNPNTARFSHWYKESNNPNSLSNKKIWSILKDDGGNIFIGTDGSGLDVFDQNKSKYVNYQSDPNNPNSISDNMILRIIEDKKGQKWMGTYGGGLNKFVSGQEPYFISFKNDPNNPNSISDNDIMSLIETSDGSIWVGTYGEGLDLFVPEKGAFIHYKSTKNSKSISSNLIMDIVEDENGYLWLATDNGLNKFNPTTGNSTVFLHDKNSDNSLSTNDLYSVLIDDEGLLWIGTNGEGIDRFDPVKEEFTHFTKKDGLANNTVYGILKGNDDNLWASTNYGLSRFNKKNFKVKNYDIDDGLQSNEFSTFSYFRSNDGELFFGGINGLTGFYPHNIIDDTISPKTIITKFQIHNTTVFPGVSNKELGISDDKKITLNKAISFIDTITISYLHNVFSFEFSALHFINSKKNKYEYKLEGFDREWIQTSSSNRRATYTNIDPGTYNFYVKGANGDGFWSQKESVITLIITPPFWKTNWFYTLVTCFSLLLILLAHRLRLNQVRLQAEKKGLEEKNEQKKALLMEIHHRVKNNLQVVNSLLSLQANNIDDEYVNKAFNEAQNRIKSMAQLHNRMSLSEDLVSINVKDHFEQLIEELVSTYGVEKIIDLDLRIENINIGINTLVPLGLIINELITNALKYAFIGKTKGRISAELKPDGDSSFLLIIKDDGVGLNQRNLDKNIDSLGVGLVNIFVKRIKGAVDFIEDGGTKVTIYFRSID